MTAVFIEEKIIKLKEILKGSFDSPSYTYLCIDVVFIFCHKSFDCEIGIFYSEREASGNDKVINLNVAVLFYFSFVNIYILFKRGKLVMCFQSLSVDPLSGMVDLVALFCI